LALGPTNRHPRQQIESLLLVQIQSSLNIVVDCANGATYHIAENVFAELGANIVVINHQPDGFNINLELSASFYHVHLIKD
jgi:phosphomannomutase